MRSFAAFDPGWRPLEPDTPPAPRVSLVHEGRYQQALADYAARSTNGTGVPVARLPIR
ncbi:MULTISPECIES: hypothetical protein [Frankia]|uniref:Uncharacterized protein n=1 Tax=Frankia alni (strain DSM 45986 / CECT 9034 / ACN14a) TaxID=326424 RepID=Q0RC48_FRAAA|nr:MULTISPECIES: hypothetical protein [Frankia]CAJ64980.1 hypothetical protein FRAAL6357 [Frankia alni ACN14a]